jgi:preprotein translocase subunit Sec63
LIGITALLPVVVTGRWHVDYDSRPQVVGQLHHVVVMAFLEALGESLACDVLLSLASVDRMMLKSAMA